ncbi:hypothetical protein PoB_006447000 [Plakobranchus ocellatus]|uniref:Uncharacterized protein n=1 Tax=Plakobranchus ocellatus TaxID=259542 RepID=A0AAV4D1R6_9GAST|nr:hypothetical protein PoB_006447000 [Plakobranchus ocellatus]
MKYSTTQPIWQHFLSVSIGPWQCSLLCQSAYDASVCLCPWLDGGDDSDQNDDDDENNDDNDICPCAEPHQTNHACTDPRDFMSPSSPWRSAF